jgi:hypothetical protein
MVAHVHMARNVAMAFIVVRGYFLSEAAMGLTLGGERGAKPRCAPGPESGGAEDEEHLEAP